MERDNRNYGNSRYNDYRDNSGEHFENYRDRYSNRGNYYGMPDQRQAYGNVQSNRSTPGGYTSYSSSPMQSGKHDDYSSREHYRYGDPNPYMQNSRNVGSGRENEFGWRSERDSSHSRGNDFNNRYGRQDNSYRYSGEGRRYDEFARDENRHTTDDRYRSYNAGTIDQYYDRGPIPERREDNDYGANRDRSESPYYEGSFDDSDFRYSGEIRTPKNRRSNDNYGTGLYASNRAYVSEHQTGSSDGERRSSRDRHYGPSGPDYRANSRISDYGYNDFGV